MRPEDVPLELVGRAWALLDSRGVSVMADDVTYLLAALIPEIQTQAPEVRCSCGFGGFHEETNPRCDKNAMTEEPK